MICNCKYCNGDVDAHLEAEYAKYEVRIGHIKTATPQELMQNETVRELVREVQDILYIGQCLCDRGHTSRNLHEPNTYCGQLDDLQDAVKKFEVKSE